MEGLRQALAEWDWALDGWIVVAGALAGAACALPGTFLLLRRHSMLGDAISHAVLPGLAGAFLLTGARSSLAMFVGAVVTGVLVALLTQWVHRSGKVDEGAALGVVFTSLFALGLVMVVQAADAIDLDPGCVLYGAIELTPLDTWDVAGVRAPRVVVVLSAVLLVNVTLIALFFKELKLSSFDPDHGTTLGLNSAAIQVALTAATAATAVASFEAVGNILVVAMLVAPPATAFLLTKRVAGMLVAGVSVAVASAVLGHVAALVAPRVAGFGSTGTSGMMAVVAGLLFVLAVLFSPREGVVVQYYRRRSLGLQILWEDILGLLYRAYEERAHEERAHGAKAPGGIAPAVGAGGGVPMASLLRKIDAPAPMVWLVTRAMRARGAVARVGDTLALTPRGLDEAQRLVRSHRLWEQYLVERAGAPPDQIHASAERLEHFTGAGLRRLLDEETTSGGVDPHGRDIPSEDPPG